MNIMVDFDFTAYPALFQRIAWGRVDAQFELFVPPDDKVSNVSIVPFVGDRCVVIQLSNGRWEMPGGTLEKDESYVAALKRELVEEAGASLISSFHPIGAWRCYSRYEQSYKSHLPFPHFYRIAGYGDVEIIAKPSNPSDGEEVALVEIISVKEAVMRFHESERKDLADLYRYAERMRRASAFIT